MTVSPIETTTRQDEVDTIVAVVAGTNGDVVFSEIEDVENDEQADRLEAQLDNDPAARPEHPLRVRVRRRTRWRRWLS